MLSEQMRARTFLELINKSYIDLSSEFLKEYVNERNKILSNYNQCSIYLSELMPLTQSHKEIKDIVKNLENILIQREEELLNIDKKIITDYPKYAQMLKPIFLYPNEIQKYLNEDEALLAYLLAEENSLLWVITKETVNLRFLDFDAKTIKKEITEFYLSIQNAIKMIESKEYQNNFDNFIGHLENLDLNKAHSLYNLLIAPVGKFIESKKRLIIIPHGPLFYFPFEVLLSQQYDKEKFTEKRSDKKIMLDEYQDLPYLIKDFQISYLQSASIIPYLKKSKKHPKTFLTFANTAAFPSCNKKIEKIIDTSFREIGLQALGLNNLERLNYGFPGIKEIEKEYGVQNCVLYFDSNATETQVKSEDLTQYDYIHFFCHGKSGDVVNGINQPVLILAEDSKNDGFLFMKEIYGLKIDANLITLAACGTGIGKLQYSEGIISLTRAFMYSGTPSVIVSLWKVDNKSTSELMVELYKNLKVLSPAESLQKAKISCMMNGIVKIGLHDVSYAHPFFWAPFVQFGKTQ